MYILIAGMVVFFGIHVMLAFAPGLRARLVRRLGDEKRYLGCFAAAAFAGLALMIWGKVMLGHIPLWQPPVWGAQVAVWLMLPAIVLLASQMGSNIQHFVRHPMLFGFALWAFAHLLANGDLGSLLLFGGFLAYALFAMVSMTRRGVVAERRKFPIIKDVMTVAAGLVVYGVLGFVHPYLFGAPAFF